MLQCVDDITNGKITTYSFTDQSEVSAEQQHHESPPSFKLLKPESVTDEQKKAISDFSGCPTS